MRENLQCELNWSLFYYSNIIANWVFGDEGKGSLTLRFYVCKLVKGKYFRMKSKLNCHLNLYIAKYITLQKTSILLSNSIPHHKHLYCVTWRSLVFINGGGTKPLKNMSVKQFFFFFCGGCLYEHLLQEFVLPFSPLHIVYPFSNCFSWLNQWTLWQFNISFCSIFHFYVCATWGFWYEKQDVKNMYVEFLCLCCSEFYTFVKCLFVLFQEYHWKT